MRHKKYPLLSIQYHPEASPGPHDAAYLFSRFARMIEEGYLFVEKLIATDGRG